MYSLRRNFNSSKHLIFITFCYVCFTTLVPIKLAIVICEEKFSNN